MLSAITDADAISEALAEFYARLSKGARTHSHVVGYPGGSDEYPLYWHKNPGLWALLEENEDGTRSWNCFGVVDPTTTGKNLDITCEINFPHDGFDRRVAGVFAEGDDGEIHVVHSGRIGGNKGPAAKDALLRRCRARRQIVEIEWPDGQTTEWIRIAPLKSGDLLHKVHRFVRDVQECKEHPGTGSADRESAADEKAAALSTKPEFSGPRAPYTVGTVEATVTHGFIVDALLEALRTAFPARTHAVGRDRHRDVAVKRGNQLLVQFEAKTNTDLTSLHTAIGQLYYHTANIDPPPARVLVIPEGLPSSAVRTLTQLGIEVLTYRWMKNCPAFPTLRHLLTRLNLTRP